MEWFLLFVLTGILTFLVPLCLLFVAWKWRQPNVARSILSIIGGVAGDQVADYFSILTVPVLFLLPDFWGGSNDLSYVFVSTLPSSISSIVGFAAGFVMVYWTYPRWEYTVRIERKRRED